MAAIASSVVAGVSMLTAVTNAAAGTFMREKYRINGEYDGCLSKLKMEVGDAAATLVEFEGFSESLSMQLMDKLSVIEDYLALLVIKLPPKIKSFRNMMGMDVRNYEVKVLDAHTSELKLAKDRLRDFAAGKTKGDFGPQPAPYYALEKDFGKGFQERVSKLRELLSSSDDGRMRRICIIGCGGSGKSCLARALYVAANAKHMEMLSEDPVYDHKFWVEASVCKNVEDILNQITKDAGLVADGQTASKVNKFLLGKKFMGILDGVCLSSIRWKDMEKAFPENHKNSRLIVTTTLHDVAKEFGSGKYYIYPVQCLGDTDAQNLFWTTVHGGSTGDSSYPEDKRTESILEKCQGLPIALASAGKYISSKDKKGFLSHDLEEQICAELSNILASKEIEFSDLKRRCLQWYEGLDYDHRMCFLYFSMYPQGYSISKKEFARKLTAERLVSEESARNSLKELINRSLISKTDGKFQILGIMFQLAMYKACAKNLVTVVDERGNIRKNKYDKSFVRQNPPCRRLVVYCSNETRRCLIPDNWKATITSLTVYPCSMTLIDKREFKAFEVLRVLDLKGCKGLNSSSAFLAICKLKLLKFLQLKGSDVEIIPKEVENLKHLETLDIRHTRVDTLPLQLITLPEIAAIFGRFALAALTEKEKETVTAFLIKESKLHTLDGLWMDKGLVFDVVMRNAKRLENIKVCGHNFLESSAPPPAPSDKGIFSCFSLEFDKEIQETATKFDVAATLLVRAMHGCSKTLSTICINSSAISNTLVGYSPANVVSVLSCIKLEGQIKSLPYGAFQRRHSLRKLCLYATGLSCEQLVLALQSLDCLEHLKLGKEYHKDAWAGEFFVPKGGFKALRSLCFKGGTEYPEMRITEGGMSRLASLELLCLPREVEEDVEMADHDVYMPAAEDMDIVPAEDVNYQIIVQGIEHLSYLDEVILHHSTPDGMVKAWERAAKAHSNFPRVMRQGTTFHV